MMDDPQDIRNWLRIDQRITTSGRLQPQDPARLAAIGVEHVINLALAEHPEALPDAASLMADAGLRYTHIPIPFNAPSEAHYRAFCVALESGEAPVHIHCILNYRVSALLYRWHRDRACMDEAQARALLERIWKPDETDGDDARAWAKLIGLAEQGGQP